MLSKTIGPVTAVELHERLTTKRTLDLKITMWKEWRNVGVKAMQNGWTKNIMLGVLLAVLGMITSPVLAQRYNFDTLPVLDPKPDFNGVDVASGSYSTASPLNFSAPGAGNLNASYSFNGNSETFSFSVFLEDLTYAPWPFSSPSERHLRVSVGGADKLFTCIGLGDCTQDVHRDGSMLTRVSEKNYIYTDRHGTRYVFYPYNSHIVSGCNGNYSALTEGCDDAGYNAAAHVSTIEYPSGEKLTYLPNTEVTTISGKTFKVNTIRSNLGYSLVIQSSDNTVLSEPNLNWLRTRSIRAGGFHEIRIILYRGTTKINTLIATRNIPSFDPGSIRQFEHIDDLGRKYAVKFRNGGVYRCNLDNPVQGQFANPLILDRTVTLPIYERSPGGIETHISYHMLGNVNPNNWIFAEANGAGTSIPVSTITRGGYDWDYDNVANSKTLTDPYLKTRTAEFSWVSDGYSYGMVYCPAGLVDSLVTSYTDALNRRNDYTYEQTLLDTATLPEQNGYDYDYDSRGNLIKITQLAKPGYSDRVIFQAGYPATCINPKTCNDPDWVEDAKGNRTDYTYSATHGGVLTVTQPAQDNGVRPKITYTYTSVNTGDGILWRQTGSKQCTEGSSCAGTDKELVMVTTYWGNTLLPQTIIQRAGDNSISATETFVYNSAGLILEKTDAEGNTTHFIYDAVGRKIGEISEDPDGSGPLPRLATHISYNNDNQPTLVKSGTVTGTTSSALNAMSVSKYVVTSYDSLGRKTEDKVISAGLIYSLTHYSYDAWNRIICTARRMNFTLPPSDACEAGSSTEGYDRITKNEYDDTGQLEKVYRAYDTPLQQVYQEYEYSENGKKIYIVDANNNQAHLEYDGYDRQTHWYFPSKNKGSLTYSTTDYEQYGYDANDNRTMYRKRDGQVLTYIYDNLNRVTRKSVPERSGLSSTHTKDVFYLYDNRGLALHSCFDSQSGQGITQSYNALGHMKNSIVNLDGVSRTLTHDHNLIGIRTKLTHTDNQAFTYNHDNLYRLTGITHPSAGTLAGFSYEAKGNLDILSGGITTDYDTDGIGRVSKLEHNLAGSANDNIWNFVYNPASQLTELSTSNPDYKSVQTPTNEDYVVNGLNQYISVGGTAHAYDANGNLTSDGETLYIYDQENRLVKATTTSGALKAELFYDPNGRLYKNVAPSATIHFLYDGDELIAEFNGTSTSVAQRYVHGISIDDPVAWFNGSTVSSTTRKHLRANHQGSIVAVSDASGNKQHLLRYDTWGAPQQSQPLRFGYTGQAWISELGLWHYKARMYSPELGRFLQADPVGYEDQMNLYAYVGNDPVNFMDSTGMSTEWGSCVGAGGCNKANSIPLLGDGSGDSSEAVQANEPSVSGFIREEGVNVLLRTGQSVGGTGQVLLGGAICYGSGTLACAVGVVIGAKGVDNFQAGIRGTDSVSQQLLVDVTGSEKAGILINAGLDLGTSVTGLFRSVSKISAFGTPYNASWYKGVPGYFEPSFRQATTTTLMIEGATSTTTIIDAVD